LNVNLFESIEALLKDALMWIESMGIHAPMWSIYGFLGLASLFVLEFGIFAGVLLNKACRKEICKPEYPKVKERFRFYESDKGSDDHLDDVFDPIGFNPEDVPARKRYKHATTSSENEENFYKFFSGKCFKDDSGRAYGEVSVYSSL